MGIIVVQPYFSFVIHSQSGKWQQFQPNRAYSWEATLFQRRFSCSDSTYFYRYQSLTKLYGYGTSFGCIQSYMVGHFLSAEHTQYRGWKFRFLSPTFRDATQFQVPEVWCVHQKDYSDSSSIQCWPSSMENVLFEKKKLLNFHTVSYHSISTYADETTLDRFYV